MPTLLIIRPSNRPQQDIQTCHAAGWQAQVLSPIEIEADRSALKKTSRAIQASRCRVLGQPYRY